MKEKLDTKLVADDIKQTCSKKQKLVFRDSTIDKVDPKNIVFGIRRILLIKFDVPKGSSLKGLNLKISKATCRKYFVLSDWFRQQSSYDFDWLYQFVLVATCESYYLIAFGYRTIHSKFIFLHNENIMLNPPM